MNFSNDESGKCRRRSPIPVVGQHYAGWPIVSMSSWCGEHVAAVMRYSQPEK